jgi:large subunit ribosomal protein L13
VVVINAEKVTMTGTKMTDKEYIRHTGYPGGQRIVKADELMKKHPIRLIEYAVKGMLPKNRLGSAIFRNLYVYEGPAHKQEAQQPKLIDLKTIK